MNKTQSDIGAATMWNRIKCAWMVLRGDAYAIPYAKVYQDYLRWTESGAMPIKMSEMCDAASWNPTRQKVDK